MKRLIELDLQSLRCNYDNCGCRTFYIVRHRSFAKYIKRTSEFNTPFKLMLICTKCGSPEVYGD
jgi:hypothetical protein